MAKIILNVELNTKGAQSGLDLLKKSLSKVTATLNQMKPDKDLTAQIKALSEYYNSLAAAAKSAAEADSKAAIEAAKVAKAEQDAAKATAQRQKAETDAAAAVARKEAAEARALDTIDRTRAAMEKRAKAAEDDDKALWNLEKAYAALSKRQEDVAAKTNIMDDALRDVAEETEDTWKEIRAFNENGEALSSTVDELRERYERLAAQTASYEKELNEQVKAEIEAEKEAQRLAESFQKSEENLDGLTLKLNNMLTAISNVEGRYPAGTFDQLKADIKSQILAVEELKESVSSSGGNVQEFIDKEQAADLATKELNGRFAELKAQTEHAAPAVATLGEKFGNLVERYAKFYASSLLVRKPLQLIQNALADVGETLVKTEDAVIELNRVLDDPQPTMEAANRLYDIAYAYGSTFESASQIAANFARAGKSWNESLQATEAALLAMNVAELNATEASDGLLSIIAQFDMETSDLIDVVDKLNKTADKNPVSTQKLLQAIQRAGSAAKNANVSFDQTLGLITAISEATNRSGQNIGTAINSLIQYSTKKIDAFASLSEKSAEMVEKFKLGLVSVVDVWNQVAEDIHNDKEARDNIISALGTDDLEELSSTLHDELGDLVSEIDGVYNVANTYRKNYFIALLDNMDRFMKVQEQLTDYQGYSQEENEKYMETYTAKVNQLQDAWQKLANDEQGILQFKKDLAELGVIFVDFVEQTGGIIDTVQDAAGIIGGLALVSKAEALKLAIADIGTVLKATFTGAAGAFQTTIGWIGAVIAISAVLNTTINAIRTAQAERRKETLLELDANKDNITALSELKKKYDDGNLSLKEEWELEDKIVPLLGDKSIALDGLAEHTEAYTKKVWELVEGLREEQKLTAQVAQDAAKDDYIEAARRALEDSARAQAKRDGGVQSFILNTNLGKSFTSLFSGTMNDADQAAEYLDKLRTRLEEAKQAYLDARGQVSDAEEKKLREYYQDLLDIYNNLSSARDNYEKQRREGLIAELEATDNLTEAQKSQLATLKALNEEHIIGRAGVVPPIKEETEAIEEAGDAAEEAGPKYDKASMGADKFAESVAGDTAALKADADAIKAVKAAQEEFNETGGLSIETISKLASLSSDWVDVLFDENGAVNVNSNELYQMIGAKQALLAENGAVINSTEEESKAVENLTEKLKDYSSQIDDVQNALSVLEAVQAEYDETGSLSIDTLQKLLELGGEYLALIVDEEGQIRLNQEAVDDLVAAKQTLLEKLIEEQTVQYAVTLIHEKMAETEQEVGTQAENAAKRVALMVSQVRELAGDSQGATLAMEGLKTALAQLGAMEGVSLTEADLDEIAGKTLNYNQGLRNLLANAVNTSSSGWQTSSGSSSSSSSKSQKDEVLEGHKDLVSLLESELTLMEHQGKSEEEQIAKIREIQGALSAQADYMRSIDASQEDINKLSSDWWKWQEKINKFAEDRQKAAEKEAEEAEKARKKAEEDAKKAEEEAKKARIAALNEETNRHKQILSDLKAELNLWQKQGKGVSDQVEEMKKIQSALHDQAEWLRYLKATQDEIEVNQADIDALSAEWWDWQEKILKLYKETLDTQRDIELDEQKKVIDALIKGFDDMEASRKEELEINERILAVEKAREDVAEAIRNAQLDYIKSTLSGYIKALSDAKTLEEKQNAVIEARKKLVQAEQDARAKAIIDTFKAEKDVKSDALSLEEKRLAVEKARQALIDAQNERTTRVYNESSGQWEYQANAKNVQSAQENLQKAVDALNAYVEEQAWNEVSAAVEKGSVSEAEVLEILTKWARESYGEGSPEFIGKIQAAFRKAMGTPASPESLSGQVSAVDTAVQNLNEYLKQEAVKELEQYIAAGNTDSAGMRSILNKWLSMGEGGELYEWRDGLLDNLESAIHSGWYDDTKVTSYIEKVDSSVESLHEYLRSRFIAEMKDLVQNGTADQMREAMDRWGDQFGSIASRLGLDDFGLSDADREWGSNLTNEKAKYEDIESFWEAAGKPKYTEEEKQRVIERMKENSRQWWMTTDKAEQQRLADLNYVLGTSMGWHRKQDGAWYDDNDVRMYDKGGVVWNPGKRKSPGKQASSGVLRGVGGIKATDRPEIILDPELTEKILAPTSEKQFRAFAETMHLMFEKGGRTRAEMPVIRNPAITDSHNTSYTVNGIPIPAASAERYTIAELFRMLPMARS